MSYIAAVRRNNNQVLVWERCPETGERIEVYHPAELYFYYDDPDGTHSTLFGNKTTKIEFDTISEWYEARQQFERERFKSGITAWESDITPELRVLANKYYDATPPKLHVTLYDIEVDTDPARGYATIDNPYAPINAISMYNRWSNDMLLLFVNPPGYDYTGEELLEAMNKVEPIPTKFNNHIIRCEDEEELLAHFILNTKDSDVLCGWNSEVFDHPYVYKRVEINFGPDAIKYLNFPNAPKARWQEVTVFGRVQQKVQQTGKVLTDYMLLIKKYEPGEKASYKLSAIEEEKELNLPKLEYDGTLAEAYHQAPDWFFRYSYRDSEILEGFEEKLGYVEVANTMVHMSCGLFDHALGTIKLHDLAFTNYCHKVLGVVVPNIRMPEIDRGIQGAFVVDTKTGLYRWVGTIDITSLYPTMIMMLNMSPETLRGQFKEEFYAAECFRDELNDVELTFVYHDTKREETRTAGEWRQIVMDRHWGISGYGVAFDLTTPGLVPTVLKQWFAERKAYQAKMREAYSEQRKILETARKRAA